MTAHANSFDLIIDTEAATQMPYRVVMRDGTLVMLG
jgi:hypothetical protein